MQRKTIENNNSGWFVILTAAVKSWVPTTLTGSGVSLELSLSHFVLVTQVVYHFLQQGKEPG